MPYESIVKEKQVQAMFSETEDDSVDSDEEGLDPYDERLNQAFWDTRTWIL